MISVAPTITESGKTLLLKAISGDNITFTRFKIGSGVIPDDNDPTKLNELINPIIEFPIKKIDTSEKGYVKLTGSFDNTYITEDFQWRELGIFCKGEDDTEVLYAYANDGDNAGVLKVNTLDIVSEQTITLIIAVGDAENVTADLTDPDEILVQHKNYINPEKISYATVGSIKRATILVEEIDVISDFTCNFPIISITGVTEEGENTELEYYASAEETYIPYVMKEYTHFIIEFDPDFDPTYFMLVQGSTLPSHFKPYGVEKYVNDNYLASVYSEIAASYKKLKEEMQSIPGGEAIVEDGSITLQKLADDVISRYTNLLNPENTTDTSIAISGLKGETTYCCNINDGYIFVRAFVENDGETLEQAIQPTNINGGISFVFPAGFSTLQIAFYESTDTSRIMVVEGNVLPKHFIPYGVEHTINDDLLAAVYATIEKAVSNIVVEDGTITLPKLGNDVISDCVNLLNPESITLSDSNGVVNVTGLEKGKGYCFNFIPYAVKGITDQGEAVDINYSTMSGNTYIYSEDMSVSTLSIPFHLELDSRHFMLVEGNTLPEHFVPYGIEKVLNDELLAPLYAEIEKITIIRETLTEGSPTHYLKNHSNCDLVLSVETTFSLPSEAKKGDQILVQADVREGGTVVYWGTDYFFFGETPYIEPGKYNFIFEYDNDGNWYVGVIPKGKGETV